MRIRTRIHPKFKGNGGRYRGTYLHGDIADYYGNDVFEFVGSHGFDEGVHNFEIEQDHGLNEVTFFLWRNQRESNVQPWRGLLVYTKDEKSYQYGLQKYYQKAVNL